MAKYGLRAAIDLYSQLAANPTVPNTRVAGKVIRKTEPPMRFDTKRDQHVSEYVIVGTLASFGWALSVTRATLWRVEALPPLGIPSQAA